VHPSSQIHSFEQHRTRRLCALTQFNGSLFTEVLPEGHAPRIGHPFDLLSEINAGTRHFSLVG
jgi:hypothetical protein